MSIDPARLRDMVWEAVAFEMETETIYTGPTFTIGDVADTVWEWNHEELRAAGLSKADIEPVALGVLNHIESHGWDEVREDFQRAARARPPEPAEPGEPRPRMPIDPNDLPF